MPKNAQGPLGQQPTEIENQSARQQEKGRPNSAPPLQQDPPPEGEVRIQAVDLILTNTTWYFGASDFRLGGLQFCL